MLKLSVINFLGGKSMNYEKIIIELLSRIKELEDRVSLLEKQINTENEKEEAYSISSSGIRKTTFTGMIREYIENQKIEAAENGATELVLVCNDIQKQFGVVNRAPSICKAMYDCMKQNDQVLFAPEKGMSTKLEIKYYLK